MNAARRGAAAIIIGNEVLSAKVEDANGGLLAKRLRDRGIELRSLRVVPDEIDAIVEAVSHGRRVAQYLFTSGGIGPTHDDVTVRAVALALGRPVCKDPQLVELVKRHAGAEAKPEAFRLAEVPEGSSLLWHGGAGFPVLHCDGIYLLPGVPQLFRLQLEAVLGTLPSNPFHLRSIFLMLGEGEIAGALDAVALDAPDVAIGSYPTFDRSLDYRVKLTVEHRDAALVERTVKRLLEVLPSSSIVRIE